MSPPAEPSGLTQPELHIVDAIVERLIPSDDTGPGAREACVGRYIARALDREYATDRETYRAGLAAIDAAARAAHGKPFTELEPNDQDTILEGAETASLPAEVGLPDGFFELIRRHAIEGMFGDPRWGGNQDQIGWKLLGYPGPKPVWTAAEQELDTLPAAEQA